MVRPSGRDEEQRVVAEAAARRAARSRSRPRRRRCGRARAPRAGSTKAATQRKRALPARRRDAAQRLQQLGVVARVVATAHRRSAPSTRRARRRARRPPARSRRRWRAARSPPRPGAPSRARWPRRCRRPRAARTSGATSSMVTSSRPSPASSGTISRSLPRLRRGQTTTFNGARALQRLALAREQRLHRRAPPAPPARAYCSAENASFSAVAWISTKRPSPVITKLQSTSACESST